MLSLSTPLISRWNGPVLLAAEALAARAAVTSAIPVLVQNMVSAGRIRESCVVFEQPKESERTVCC